MMPLSYLEFKILLGAAALLASAFFWIGFAHFRYRSWYRSRRRSPPDPGSAGWALLYLRILKSMIFLVVWHFRGAFQGGLRVPKGGAEGGPVLCIHGFHMNTTAMVGIRRELERRGRPTRAVFLGMPYRSPQVYATAVEGPLRDLVERFPDQPVDLVAHSMGGLVARVVLARNPDLASRIGKVVTLGTPHRGTALLRWIRFGPVYRMMARGSDFLRELPDFAETAPQAATTTVAAVPDFVVYPEETALLPDSQAVTVRGVGHSGLLIESRIIELVADFVVEGGSPGSGEPLEILL